MTHWSDALVRLGACGEAVEWAKTQPSLKTAWNTCERGDWMLWLAARIGVDRRAIVLAACDCAELSAPHWRERDKLACVWALDSARRWARGEADAEEVRAAAHYAAYAAHYAAYAARAAHAASHASALAECANLVRARISAADVRLEGT